MKVVLNSALFLSLINFIANPSVSLLNTEKCIQLYKGHLWRKPKALFMIHGFWSGGKGKLTSTFKQLGREKNLQKYSL